MFWSLTGAYYCVRSGTCKSTSKHVTSSHLCVFQCFSVNSQKRLENSLNTKKQCVFWRTKTERFENVLAWTECSTFFLYYSVRDISSSILNDFTSNQHKLIWVYAIFKLEFLFVCLLVFWVYFFLFFQHCEGQGLLVWRGLKKIPKLDANETFHDILTANLFIMNFFITHARKIWVNLCILGEQYLDFMENKSSR